MVVLLIGSYRDGVVYVVCDGDESGTVVVSWVFIMVFFYLF